MIERIERKFYPENNEEERNIRDLLKKVEEMSGCETASICEEGDHHYIDAVFKRRVDPDTEFLERFL